MPWNDAMPFYRWMLQRYYRFLQLVIPVLMAMMILCVALQILSRYTLVIPRYIWTEEVARFCFVWIIMIGSMIAVRDGTHFEVDLFRPPKTNRDKGFSRMAVHVSMMLMAVVFTWYGCGFAKFGFAQTSEMSGINMLSIYIAFPLAGASWSLFLVERMVEDVRLIRNDPRDVSEETV